MIVFVAPNPFKAEKREGFLQRVAAIDGIFSGEKLYYDDIDVSKLPQTLLKADMIYVHSIYMAQKILFLYPILSHKIVTDLHGVVPEEEEFSGNAAKASEMADVENVVFASGVYFVTVTDAMINHFDKKYKNTKEKRKWVRLPIFEVNAGFEKVKKDSHSVVYAGGAQPWQNTNLMIQAIQTNTSYKYTILTQDKNAFSQLKNLDHDISIATVDSGEVALYYSTASLGFVLRDDVIVNRVACPTKLIEYLSYGVVPIVKTPHIGDFNALGYQYVKYEDFIEGKMSQKEIVDAQRKNLSVIKKLQVVADVGRCDLVDIFTEVSVSSRKLYRTVRQDTVASMLCASKDAIEAYTLKESIRQQDGEIHHLRDKVVEYDRAVRELLEDNKRLQLQVDVFNNTTSKKIVRKIRRLFVNWMQG